jgi:pimeloyl-ACP methyl ester carboxylesterase
VADVLALRSALGYSRISLVGGSYGSHLALALMKLAPEAVERVVLFGVEGLDHTWDNPGGRLAAYERIAGAAEVSPELRPAIPADGLLGALRTVLARLETAPQRAAVGEGEGRTEVVVDAELVRRVAGYQAGRRSRPDVWPGFLLDLLAGDYSVAAQGALALRELRLDDPMHYMMDCASGISAERAARYRSDPASELLGGVNLEYETLCEVWQAPDLGPAFRAPLVSSIPTLIVHGTWDTSTPIENAHEVVATLSRGHLVEVIGGGHGALYTLLRHWPPMEQRLAAFLRGEAVRFPSSVTLPPVTFSSRAAD